ncbi:hypothetical protein LZ318_39855 [Saccharopolyspora indica]|uniref:hypothetical protein n=1 Tax=Saccharopolyspora indica TaxID=1229659 RepID=UPI0022EA797F|nr:hypothetical protein [Saccharopolyspora indica]MDA3649362.1 hypothetical protein [Saccharopolyspora indica]
MAEGDGKPRRRGRALAVGLLLVLGIAAGIWWIRGGPEAGPGTPEELTALLPAAGTGPFRTKEQSPAKTRAILASLEQCGPEPVVQKFRTRAPASFAFYGMNEDSTALVAVVRLDPEDREPVREALRTSGHCDRPGTGDERVWWTKVDRPWFGEESALFRETYSGGPPEDPVVSGGGSVWSLAASGDWLVAVSTSTMDELERIYPDLLAGWDRATGTHFLAPGRSRSDCREPELPADVPAEAEEGLATIRGMACQGRAELVRAMQSAPLVLDSGFATGPAAVDIGDPVELARLLETPAVHRNGALSFRRGDSAAVFSTVRSGGLAGIGWDAYVRHCATAVPVAARQCGPDPNGPLGGADWPSLAAGAGCASDFHPFGPISHALFQDVTGDGRQDAIIALLCESGDGAALGEVRVHDGASVRDSPRLIQSLIRDDPGPLGTGVLPVALTADGADLVVESHAWHEFIYPGDDPDVRVLDRFRWRGSGFERVAREVRGP